MNSSCQLSDHFWAKWEERKDFMLKEGITPYTIKEFALNPDIVLPDDIYPSRSWHIKRIRGRCLKIVVERTGDKLIVITAYFDRTLRRKGLCG